MQNSALEDKGITRCAAQKPKGRDSLETRQKPRGEINDSLSMNSNNKLVNKMRVSNTS